MRSGNPALNENTFAQFRSYEHSTTMTIEGTATKTAILLAVVVAAASITWNRALADDALTMPLVFGGLIGGLPAPRRHGVGAALCCGARSGSCSPSGNPSGRAARSSFLLVLPREATFGARPGMDVRSS